MDTLGSRLLRLRTKKRLTQANIAKALNVTPSSVTQWEQDSYQPRGANLIALTNMLGCDVNWLLTGQGVLEPQKPEKNSPSVQKAKKRFPVISWKQISKLGDVSFLDVESVFKESYPSPIECSNRTFILKVAENNMSPTFTQGEFIFVDPEVKAMGERYVVAQFADEKEATIKKIITKDNHALIQTVNSNRITPEVSIDDHCTIVGTVILSIKFF